jgi:hypothetical protein
VNVRKSVDIAMRRFSSHKFLGVIYSATLLGITVSPYVYLCSRVVTLFPPRFVVVLVLWLLPSTTLLVTAAFALTGLERRLRQRLRGAFTPVSILLVLCASGSTLAILTLLSTYTLFEPVEYWHSLIVVLSSTIGATLVVLLTMRPTRLESALTLVFDRKAPGYRILGLSILLALLAAVVFALYQYHLFKLIRPV